MAASNDNPKIPSFKPTKKDDDKGAGGPLSALGKSASSPSGGGMKWPTFGKTGAGGLKLRGMPGGGTIMERLRNLRKKDMAFIAAGLSVLLLAPVAEHFLMNPEDEGGALTQGFDQKGPLFPDGTSIYESGTGGFSPGGLIGQGTDVITPLNVRDPAALVMGPGAMQKPAAGVSAPAPKTTQKKGGWKDALKQAASAGTKKAIRKSKIPRPNVKLAGALRGLNALSGASKGGGPSYKLLPLSASNVPNRARASGALSRSQAIPGYRGAANRSGQRGGGPESLKAAGARQSDIFNKGRGAAALDTAARSQIPSGGGYGQGGGPGTDSRRKSPGGNTSKDNRSLGESLAFIRAKLEMNKAIALKWKKKEWNEFGKKKMIEEALYKIAIDKLLGEGLFGPIGAWTAGLLGNNLPGGSPSGVTCQTDAGPIKLVNSGENTYKCHGKMAYMKYVKGSPTGTSTACNAGCFPFGSGSGTGTDTPPPDRGPQPGGLPGSELAGTELGKFLKNCERGGQFFSEPESAVCKGAKRLKNEAVEKLKGMENKTKEAKRLLREGLTHMANGNSKMGVSYGAMEAAIQGVAIIGGTADDNVEKHGKDAQTALDAATPDVADVNAKLGKAKAKYTPAEAGFAAAITNDPLIGDAANGYVKDAKEGLDKAAEQVKLAYQDGEDALGVTGQVKAIVAGRGSDVLRQQAGAVEAKITAQETTLKALGGGGITAPGSGKQTGSHIGTAVSVYDEKFAPAAVDTNTLFESMNESDKTMAQAKIIANAEVKTGTSVDAAIEIPRVKRELGDALTALNTTAGVSQPLLAPLKVKIGESNTAVGNARSAAGF